MAQNSADASAASTVAQRYGPVQEGTDRGAMIDEINDLRTTVVNIRGEAHQALTDQHHTLALEAKQEFDRQAASYATSAQMHTDAIQNQSRDMLLQETTAWNKRHHHMMATAEGDLARIQLVEQHAQTSVVNLHSELEQSVNQSHLHAHVLIGQRKSCRSWSTRNGGTVERTATKVRRS